MTSKEIVSILNACKDLHVQEIKIGDVEIKFSDLTNHQPRLNTGTNIIPYVSDIEVPEDPKDPLRNTDTKELADEFIRAQVMASDPEEFEKMMRDH